MKISLSAIKDPHAPKVLVENEIRFPAEQPGKSFVFSVLAADGKLYEIEISKLQELIKFQIELHNQVVAATRPSKP